MTYPMSASAHVKRRCGKATVVGATFVLAVTGAAATSANAAARTAGSGVTLTHLTRFGSGLGSGSTVGPDGAIYVTDGTNGSVDRVDRRTGAVTVFATGLPPKVLGIGGAMDVAFLDQRMYVLVTMVGGDIVGGPHIGDATVGDLPARRPRNLLRRRRHRLLVGRPPAQARVLHHHRRPVRHDPGPRWLPGHRWPPQPGVESRLGRSGQRGCRLRRPRADRPGIARRDDLGHPGRTGTAPARHRPSPGAAIHETGRASPPPSPAEVAHGASLLVDVEMGPRHQLYALSQGQWDGVMEGSPARPNTGRLVRVTPDGTLDPVVDANGNPLVLDRPTSMEFAGGIAFIVSLSGDVYTVRGL